MTADGDYLFKQKMWVLFVCFLQELKGKMESSEKRMSTARCAELCALALANGLDEAWIALNPVLLFTYMFQYFPNLSRV